MPFFIKRNDITKVEKQKLISDIEKYIKGHYTEDQEETLSLKEESIDIPMMAAPAASMPMPMQCSRTSDTLSKSKKRNRRRNLDDLINNLDETFSQMLLRLIDERGLKDSAVYKKANVDRRHFSKIRNNIDYLPTKKTVFSFAIALELSLDEARDLMNKAGYSISRSSKFDVIISYFLENGIYDIFEINEILFMYEQPVLGE